MRDIRKIREVSKIMHLIYKLDESAIKTLTEVFLIESLSPSSNWSFINRLIVKLHNTNDARSFDDWRKINRLPHVHSAISIITPVKKHVKKLNKKKDQELEYDLRYYTTKNVYRYEDTQGVEYPSIELKTKEIINKDDFMNMYEIDNLDYNTVKQCVTKLVPSTDRYDNELVRFLITNIIIGLYNPIELEKMEQFDQIKKYNKNIIYYALSSLAYSAKILEDLLITKDTQVREQKNEYLCSGGIKSNTPLVN